MLNNKIKSASLHSFSVDKNTIKATLQNLVADGRPGYKNSTPSDAAIRTYRALNLYITYRKAENKDAAKLGVESSEHVNTFDKRLADVEKRHPGIFHDPRRLWNMDETHVDGEFGRRIKTFTDASSHHGGFKSVHKGSGKRVTAVLAASVSGHITPLFCIAAGKYIMEDWIKPLPRTFFKHENGASHWLAESGWLRSECVLRCTLNGSIEEQTLPMFIDHFDNFVRQIVPPDLAVALFLDGHFSRNGIEWVEKAQNRNIEVLVLPANTTHFCSLVTTKSIKRSKGQCEKLVMISWEWPQLMCTQLGSRCNGRSLDTRRLLLRTYANHLLTLACGLWIIDSQTEWGNKKGKCSMWKRRSWPSLGEDWQVG